MKKYLLFIPLSIFTIYVTSAQIGGRYVFTFLKQQPSARMTGLNGSQIAWRDDDIAVAYANPALLNAQMHTALSYNQDFLLGKIKTGYFGSGYHIEKLKTTFQAGIQFINYGKFKQTDEFGNIQGEFTAADYALVIGAGRQINERLSAGLNIKFINSRLESYQSTGLVADLAGSYWHPEKQFGLSILFKNIGAQLSTYNGIREDVPMDVQVGITKKLKRAPFRFSFLLHDLNRWNLRYDNPFDNPVVLLGEESTEPSTLSKTVDNLFRHINFGGEVMLGKKENFRLRLGYSHQVRKELTVQNIRSIAGFSLGFGVKVNRFRIDYGFGRQHVAGGMNHLSLSTNISEFLKKSVASSNTQ